MGKRTFRDFYKCEVICPICGFSYNGCSLKKHFRSYKIKYLKKLKTLSDNIGLEPEYIREVKNNFIEIEKNLFSNGETYLEAFSKKGVDLINKEKFDERIDKKKKIKMKLKKKMLINLQIHKKK